MDRNLLTMPQTAARLGRSYAWFTKNRADLFAEGFPEPVPGCGNMWDPRAIDLWLDTFIHITPPDPTGPAGGNVHDIDHELAERARDLAGGIGD